MMFKVATNGAELTPFPFCDMRGDLTSLRPYRFIDVSGEVRESRGRQKLPDTRTDQLYSREYEAGAVMILSRTKPRHDWGIAPNINSRVWISRRAANKRGRYNRFSTRLLWVTGRDE
jgi:hypothetical protein